MVIWKITEKGLSSPFSISDFMTEALLFDCFTHCSVDESFCLQQEEETTEKSKLPPIVDMIVVAEDQLNVCIYSILY